MSGVIRAIGWIVSLVLIALSLYSIISSGEVGYQSWIFLLLIPFSVSLALSSKGGENDPHNISEEWDEDEKRFFSMHHPFTSAKPEHLELLDTEPEKVIANAYDLVINGNEIGGGSIRIHDTELQRKILKILGFSDKEAERQFGFLMKSFQYGAPPHGGIAFGLDRLVAILKGKETIRNFIAFPKNNNGRDVMIDAPSEIESKQLNELSLLLKSNK